MIKKYKIFWDIIEEDIQSEQQENEIEKFVDDIKKKTEISATNIKDKYNSSIKTKLVNDNSNVVTTKTTTIDPKSTINPTNTDEQK